MILRLFHSLTAPDPSKLLIPTLFNVEKDLDSSKNVGK